MKLLLAGVLALAVCISATPTVLIGAADAAPAVTAASDACGVQPLKPDGTAWRCTFRDDFAGDALDRTKWVPQTAFATGTANAIACYLDSPSTVAVGNGSLNLTVRKVFRPTTCSVQGTKITTKYVAGMVSTYHLFSQQFGRFEARIKNAATTSPGLHEAFWLWPDDRVASTAVWPEAGEIDVSETYSVYPKLSIPYLHYSADADGPQAGVNTAWTCAANRGQWNTYTLEWSPEQIEILVNGTSCLVNKSGDAAFLKPYIVVLTAGLGFGTNAYDGRAPLPATMSVDYVRVWK
jgi:beta-glucanase (GH16 family)